MWSCVHVVQVVLCACCICEVVYTLCTRCASGTVYMWYCVQVVHVALCIFGMLLRVLCNCFIATCVFMVLYSGCIYVFCCTLGIGVCVVLYTGCRCMCRVVHWV